MSRQAVVSRESWVPALDCSPHDAPALPCSRGARRPAFSPPAARVPPPCPNSRLVPGSDSIVVPFAEATDAAWLGGDRWAVLLPGGPEAGIVDFANRSRTTLGTKATLESPFSLFRARRHAVRRRAVQATADALDAGRRVRAVRTGVRPGAGGIAAGPGWRGALLHRAPAGGRAGRERQPRLGGGGRAHRLRGGYGGATRSHRPGQGGEPDGRAVRAPGVQRRRSLGRVSRRDGVAGAGLPQSGGFPPARRQDQ